MVTELAREIKEHKNLDISEGFVCANAYLLNEEKRRESCMATTLIACILNEITGETTIAHVGDSRAYVFNDAIWKTKDHRPVQDLLELGVITEEQAFRHPEKSRLNQAVGVNENLHVDVHRETLNDSVILLCSDGLSDFVRDDDMQVIAVNNDPKTACSKLVKEAIINGSLDDITIIIANIGKRKTIA